MIHPDRPSRYRRWATTLYTIGVVLVAGGCGARFNVDRPDAAEEAVAIEVEEFEPTLPPGDLPTTTAVEPAERQMRCGEPEPVDPATVDAWHETDFDGDGAPDRWAVLDGDLVIGTDDGTVAATFGTGISDDGTMNLDLDGDGRQEAIVTATGNNLVTAGLLADGPCGVGLIGDGDGPVLVAIEGRGNSCLGACSATLRCEPGDGEGVVVGEETTPVAAEDYNGDGVLDSADLTEYLDGGGDPAELARQWRRSTWTYRDGEFSNPTVETAILAPDDPSGADLTSGIDC